MQRRNLSAAAFGAAALGAPCFAATASPSAPKWDETFDVIIVGSGSAGLTAAVRCKNLGIKRVLVIEKLPVMGGNSCIAVGDICAVDSPITRKAGTKDSLTTPGD